MSFKTRKRTALNTMEEHDRSKKGSVDKQIKPLLQAINKHPDYYTTSSCSGRILLLIEPKNKKKNGYEWPLVTHEQAQAEHFIQTIHSLETNELVWFRMQTAIMHVACKTLESAQQLIDCFYPHGWKRTGIFSTTNDYIIEILSVEKMDVPVMKAGTQLVTNKYIEFLVDEANDKLATTHNKLFAAEQRVKNLLKKD